MQDIIRCKPGVTPEARIQTEMEAFLLLITPEIIDIIVRETNRYATNCYGHWNSQHPDNKKNSGLLFLIKNSRHSLVC